MAKFLKHKSNLGFQKTVLICNQKLKDIMRLSLLKNKKFRILLKKDIDSSSKEKNVPQLLLPDTMVLILINEYTKYLILEALFKISTLKKIIVIETEKSNLGVESKDRSGVIYYLNSKIFSKKKFFKGRKIFEHLGKNQKILLLIRRETVPIFCVLKFKALIKLFSVNFKKRMGIIFKEKIFFFSINSLRYLSELKIFKLDLEEKFQRLSGELGLLSRKIIYFKSKEFLYTFSYIFEQFY
jgi:hypothetical protein